jgi:hypothetical protein
MVQGALQSKWYPSRVATNTGFAIIAPPNLQQLWTLTMEVAACLYFKERRTCHASF